MEDELSGESFSLLEVYVSFFKVNSVLYAGKQFFLIVVFDGKDISAVVERHLIGDLAYYLGKIT